MSLLDKYTDILVDASALALLHTKEYKDFIPSIIAKFNVYTTKLAIIEFLSLLNYYKVNFTQEIIENLYNIYKIIDIDEKIMYRSSLILSDLIRHNTWADSIDIIHAAISLEKKLIIITIDEARYDSFKKYGVLTVHVDNLINNIKQIIKTSHF